MAKVSAEWLRSIGFGGELPEASLAMLAEAMTEVSCPADTALIVQGEPGARLLVLVEGQAEARLRSAAGGVTRLARFGPGDCFGEMSLLTGEPTSADVVALTPCALLALERAAFDQATLAHPALLRDFLRVIARRLRVADVAMGDAQDRADQMARLLKQQATDSYDELIGRETGTKELRRHIEQLAAVDQPVLIEGEYGTGKELVARLIHFRGERREGLLFSVDCARVMATPWGDPLFGAVDCQGPTGTAYVDLAADGTLLLRNVDTLPPLVQGRLLAYLTGSAKRARILATVRTTLAAASTQAALLPDLAALLGQRTVSLLPLRERKRDIVPLAEHFLRRHAERLGKTMVGFEEPALTKLVTHDYRAGNVRELEEAVERAVILTDDGLVRDEAVLFGVPRPANAGGPNLLMLPRRLVDAALRFYPTVFRRFLWLAFLATIAICFVGPRRADQNLGLTLAWGLWWPGLLLSFFFFGRAWCALCPMATTGEFVQRRLGRDLRVPAWIKTHDHTIVVVGFFLIMWVEEVLSMPRSGPATGGLLLFIATCAVVASIAWPRRTWCRHLCPLGGLAGASATTSLLELRPTADICLAKCHGHDCYKGSDLVDGCPMFQHVMFVASNQHCVMCLRCVQSCPNGSPRLVLRPPARELWHGTGEQRDAATLTALLSGLLPALLVFEHAAHQALGSWPDWLRQHHFAGVTLIMLLSGWLPPWLLRRVERLLRAAGREGAAEELRRRTVAWLPLVVTGFTCYHLDFTPVIGHLRVVVNSTMSVGAPNGALTFSLLAAVELAMLLLGLAATAIALWGPGRADDAHVAGRSARGDLLAILGAALYCVMIACLLLLRR